MTDINLISSEISGFLKTDFDQIKGYLQTGTVLAPNVIVPVAQVTGVATVGLSGDYDDLVNLPFIPTEFNELDDVATAVPLDGQVIGYQSSTAKWRPKTLSVDFGSISEDLVPALNNAFSIGTTSKAFDALYLTDGTHIYKLHIVNGVFQITEQ